MNSRYSFEDRGTDRRTESISERTVNEYINIYILAYINNYAVIHKLHKINMYLHKKSLDTLGTYIIGMIYYYLKSKGCS